MPGKRPVYCELFDEAVTEDVEDLLARFQQTDSIRYEDFSAIWREMGFSDIFIGMTHMSESKRFSRIALATAMKYFLPPYSYQIRVGGLYLMFGFYHTQLAVPSGKIRLALRDWDSVQKFLKDSVSSGHHDVVYIYHKLVSVKAIHFVAMQHTLTFQKQRKPKKEPVCAEFLGRATAIEELISSDFMEELRNIQGHYENLKGATAQVGPQVTMTHQDFAARLKDCMTGFLTWQQKTFSQGKIKKKPGDEDDDDDEEKQAEEDSCGARARLLCSIKQKSFKNISEASKSRRHRQTETVETCSSGAEQVQVATYQRKRMPSLRARTWKSLGLMKDTTVHAWLLSAPEHQDRTPMKTVQPVPPCKV